MDINQKYPKLNMEIFKKNPHWKKLGIDGFSFFSFESLDFDENLFFPEQYFVLEKFWILWKNLYMPF